MKTTLTNEVRKSAKPINAAISFQGTWHETVFSIKKKNKILISDMFKKQAGFICVICGDCLILLTIKFRSVLKSLITNHHNSDVFIIANTNKESNKKVTASFFKNDKSLKKS